MCVPTCSQISDLVQVHPVGFPLENRFDLHDGGRHESPFTPGRHFLAFAEPGGKIRMQGMAQINHPGKGDLFDRFGGPAFFLGRGMSRFGDGRRFTGRNGGRQAPRRGGGPAPPSAARALRRLMRFLTCSIMAGEHMMNSLVRRLRNAV